MECGRTNCRTCAQPGDKKEPCTTRNVLYESECAKCNPPGTRKVADRDGLAEKRDVASLYVGESARSISERALEHWRDAESGKEESHMLEHQSVAHRGEQASPEFHFRVVKKCQSSLERQVREAVRIQMRGNVLNKKGMYNRCKLTRLVVDSEWEERMWLESWAKRVVNADEECVRESKTNKRKETVRGGKKRIKLDQAEEVPWGEVGSAEEEARIVFLYSEPVPPNPVPNKQKTIRLLIGQEGMCRSLLRELLGNVVDWASLVAGAEEWEEWSESKKKWGESLE